MTGIMIMTCRAMRALEFNCCFHWDAPPAHKAPEIFDWEETFYYMEYESMTPPFP